MIILGGDGKKKMASVIVANLGHEGASERNEDEFNERAGEGYDSDMAYAANDIMKAIKANDVMGLKSALYSFFEICESSPHEEGEHIKEE